MFEAIGDTTPSRHETGRTPDKIQRKKEQGMTILKSEKNPELELEIGKGKCLLTLNGQSTFYLKHLLKVELQNLEYQIESLLISGIKEDKISTAKLLNFLTEIGFLFTPTSFRKALIKDLTLEERFRFEGFKKKSDTITFQKKKYIMIFHSDFVKSISDHFEEEKYVKLIYDSEKKQIRVVFCEKPEKGERTHIYKLTFHPDFCQMQITCKSFVKDHKLELEGKYTIRLSEERPEWIIQL